MADVESLTVNEMLTDLEESRWDISNCQQALRVGVTEYSGGTVQDRIDANRIIIQRIEAELLRRGVSFN